MQNSQWLEYIILDLPTGKTGDEKYIQISIFGKEMF